MRSFHTIPHPTPATPPQAASWPLPLLPGHSPLRATCFHAAASPAPRSSSLGGLEQSSLPLPLLSSPCPHELPHVPALSVDIASPALPSSPGQWLHMPRHPGGAGSELQGPCKPPFTNRSQGPGAVLSTAVTHSVLQQPCLCHSSHCAEEKGTHRGVRMWPEVTYPAGDGARTQTPGWPAPGHARPPPSPALILSACWPPGSPLSHLRYPLKWSSHESLKGLR